MRTRSLQLAILLSLSVAGSCRREEPPPTPAPVGGRDFGRTPPGVESATIRALPAGQPGGNALLEVRFERGDTRVREGVPIFPSGKEVVLRDDGANGDAAARDGIFSAIVDFDFNELRTDVERG